MDNKFSPFKAAGFAWSCSVIACFENNNGGFQEVNLNIRAGEFTSLELDFLNWKDDFGSYDLLTGSTGAIALLLLIRLVEVSPG